MKVQMHPLQRQKYFSHLFSWGVAIGVALFTPLLLPRVEVAAHIDDGIIALGFDSERAALIGYLLLIFFVSVLAAFLLQHRRAAWTLYRQLLSIEISVRLLTAVGGHSWTLWAKQFGESFPLLESAASLSLHDREK